MATLVADFLARLLAADFERTAPALGADFLGRFDWESAARAEVVMVHVLGMRDK
jgi:hypothetical protein